MRSSASSTSVTTFATRGSSAMSSSSSSSDPMASFATLTIPTTRTTQWFAKKSSLPSLLCVSAAESSLTVRFFVFSLSLSPLCLFSQIFFFWYNTRFFFLVQYVHFPCFVFWVSLLFAFIGPCWDVIDLRECISSLYLRIDYGMFCPLITFPFVLERPPDVFYVYYTLTLSSRKASFICRSL